MAYQPKVTASLDRTSFRDLLRVFSTLSFWQRARGLQHWYRFSVSSFSPPLSLGVIFLFLLFLSGFIITKFLVFVNTFFVISYKIFQLLIILSFVFVLSAQKRRLDVPFHPNALPFIFYFITLTNTKIDSTIPAVTYTSARYPISPNRTPIKGMRESNPMINPPTTPATM